VNINGLGSSDKKRICCFHWKPGVFGSSAWQPIFDLRPCLASRSRHKNLRRFLAKILQLSSVNSVCWI